jgi:Uncharacterized conserved protein (DUF2235).
MANNIQNCIPCKQFNHWIEIRLVDEHAQSFKGTLNGTLRANDGVAHTVKFQDGYLLKTGLPAGPVQIAIATDELLKAAYTHAPREKGTASPVPDFAKKEQGYEGHEQQYQNITVGDIWLRAPETIPERHKPQATGKKLKLVADNSYVLEVRAFHMLTVRLGMFFDGTGNNSYNAELARDQTRIWATRCENEQQAATLSQWCGASPNAGSASNEITNIQKLHDFYQFSDTPVNNVFIHRQYIEGIGTTNDGSSATITNDSKYGMATGEGDTGVDAKVKKGCDIAAKSLKEPLRNSDYDGVVCFQFDVFGFSRGAAAARHFVNVVTQGANGYLGKALQEQEITLPAHFDWQNPQHCQFTFVGVFDTVAAIVDPADGDFSPANDDNPGIHLALPVKQTMRAVHLTAADEFRDYFALNQLNPAAQFTEISVPGAHSDVGGGYYSRYYLNAQNPQSMNRALQEDIIVSAYSCGLFMYPSDASIKRTSAWRKAEADRARLIRDGWAPAAAIQLDYKITRQNHKTSDTYVLLVKVIMQRIVEGELSRIHLRLMYGLAKYAKVPLRNFVSDNSSTQVSTELNEIADEILREAEQGRVSPQLMALHVHLRPRYVHYSANLNLVTYGIHPNAPTANNQRHVYPCYEEA